MSTRIERNKVDLAWKLYNYLNTWEDKIFMKKSPNNAAFIFVLTLLALHGKLTISDLVKKSGVKYAIIYKYIEGLYKYFQLITRDDEYYELSSDLIKSVDNAKITLNKVNEKVFATVMNNMQYHTQIFHEHLDMQEDNEKFTMMKALLNPVISNPIHANDCRKLSLLGYMKYKPQKKELKLNAFAYNKDWVGTNVI